MSAGIIQDAEQQSSFEDYGVDLEEEEKIMCSRRKGLREWALLPFLPAYSCSFSLYLFRPRWVYFVSFFLDYELDETESARVGSASRAHVCPDIVIAFGMNCIAGACFCTVSSSAGSVHVTPPSP